MKEEQSIVLVETTSHLRPRRIALIAAVLIVAIIGFIAYVRFQAGLSIIPNVQAIDMKENANPLTLLYAGFASGLFFLPVPAEILFTYAMKQGASIVWSIVAVIGGFLTGLIISYLIGLKLSRTVQYFLSPKKIYGLRRKVNKYGGYVIFAFNALPGPSPQLTFGLGIARYNFTRLITLALVGNIIKYAAVAAFMTLFR